MKTAFTPGPWRLAKRGEAMGLTVTLFSKRPYGSHEDVLGKIHSGGFTGIANAHLIEAAPELYEALSELANVSRSYLASMDADDIVALDKANAALKKARGER